MSSILQVSSLIVDRSWKHTPVISNDIPPTSGTQVLSNSMIHEQILISLMTLIELNIVACEAHLLSNSLTSYEALSMWLWWTEP